MQGYVYVIGCSEVPARESCAVTRPATHVHILSRGLFFVKPG